METNVHMEGIRMDAILNNLPACRRLPLILLSLLFVSSILSGCNNSHANDSVSSTQKFGSAPEMQYGAFVQTGANYTSQSAFCRNTTKAAFMACGHETEAAYWITIGNCNYLSNRADRKECSTKAREARAEGKGLCKDQTEARNETCHVTGRTSYNQQIHTASLVDIAAGGEHITANP